MKNRKSRVALKYNSLEKIEEDKNADKAALAIYEDEFEVKTVTKKLLMKPKAFIKGGTFDITNKTVEPTGSGTLYIP
jgi:hypothetical protein